MLRKVKGAAPSLRRAASAMGRRHFRAIASSPVDRSSASFQAKEAANAELLERLQRTEVYVEGGGGEKAVQRHVQKNGKMLVRDRVRMLRDDSDDATTSAAAAGASEDGPAKEVPAAFLEIGKLAGLGLYHPKLGGDVQCAGVVGGIVRVAGRDAMVVANDATVKGGAQYPISVKKALRLQEIAESLRLPTFYVVDSAGAFLPLQAEIFPDKEHGGRSFYNQARMSALGIPQVAVVAGSCTAGGAYQCTMSDEV